MSTKTNVNEPNSLQPTQSKFNLLGVLTIYVNRNGSCVTKGFELKFEEQRETFYKSIASPYSRIQINHVMDLVRTYNQKMLNCDDVYMQSVVCLLTENQEVKRSMLDLNNKDLGVVLIMDAVLMQPQVIVYPYNQWQQKYLDVRSSTAYRSKFKTN